MGLTPNPETLCQPAHASPLWHPFLHSLPWSMALPPPRLRALREGLQPRYLLLCTPWSPADGSPEPGELGSPYLSGPVQLLRGLLGPRGHGQIPAGKEQTPPPTCCLPLSWLRKWASSSWALLDSAGGRSLSNTSRHAPSSSLPVLSLRWGLDLHHPILFISPLSAP